MIMNSLLTGFLRQCAVALAVLAALTVLLGVAYPAAVWTISRIDSHAAEGARTTDARGCDTGSDLIGLDPQVPTGTPDPYLHARVLGAADGPMAPGDPSASAASNQGPNSETLHAWIVARRAAIAAREGVTPTQVPPDAVTGSGSGLDPDISPDYAALQVSRLARENRMSEAHVRSIIAEHTSPRQWGFLGQPRVNVLEVNLALGHTASSCR